MEIAFLQKWTRLSFFFEGKIRNVYITIAFLGAVINVQTLLKKHEIHISESYMYGVSSFYVLYLSSVVAVIAFIIFMVLCPREIKILPRRNKYVETTMSNLQVWNTREKLRLIKTKIGENPIIFRGTHRKVSDVIEIIDGRVRSEEKKGEDELPSDVKNLTRYVVQLEYQHINVSRLPSRILITIVLNMSLFLSSSVSVEVVILNLFRIMGKF